MVKRRKGQFAATIGDLFLDLDAKVAEVVIEKVKAALAESGVEAVVERIPAT